MSVSTLHMNHLRPAPAVVADPDRALSRLLGPVEAEVGCDACFEHLDRYVELDLACADADAAVPGLRAHLHGCPACREEHESLLALVAGEGPPVDGSYTSSSPT